MKNKRHKINENLLIESVTDVILVAASGANVLLGVTAAQAAAE